MRILCIGDSNTWGFNPANQLRFEKHFGRACYKRIVPMMKLLKKD